MAYKNTVKAVPLDDISSASITGSYAIINSGGLPNPCFMLRIMNASNKDVTISYDGVTDHEYVLANTTLQVDCQNNAQPPSYVANFPKGMVVWAKGTAGIGNIYVSGYYNS